MKLRVVTIILAMLSLAAAAFEGGRRFEEAQISVPVAKPATEKTVEQPEPQLSNNADNVIRDIAHVSFDEGYQTLAAAPLKARVTWAKEIEQIPTRPTRWAALGSFFKTLIQIDPAAAAETIRQLKGDDRFIAMTAVKDAAPPRALRSVADLLLTFDPMDISGCSFDFLRDILDEWSNNDPLAVKQFLEEHPDQLKGYSSTLVRVWAAYDPESARAFAAEAIEKAKAQARQQYDGDGDPYIVDGMEDAWIEGLFENNRTAAMNYVLNQNTNDERSGAAPLVVAKLFIDSPEEARSFISRLPKEKRGNALSGITQIADRFIYGDADDRIRSPEFVANWMVQFPPEVWSKSISQIMVEWRYKDREQLFAWMSQLPPDTRRQVVSEYEPYMARDEVEKEFTAVMNVTDGPLRDELLRRVMHQGNDSRRDVLAALQNSQLTPEQKKYFAGLIPKQDYEVAESPSEDDE